MDREELPPLDVGMWLGTGNRVAELTRLKHGWRLTDTTGATYQQSQHPDGLAASDRPESCVGLPRRPWPGV